MYAILKDNAIERYPLSLPELRRTMPRVSFSATPAAEDLALFGIVEVMAGIQPTYDVDTQTLVVGTPVLEDGQWREQWSVRSLTAEELFDRVPKSVTSLQGMRAIKAVGLVPAFLAWKDALDPVDDFEAIAFLDKAQNWVYDDPVLNTALEQLGMSGQKAALFTLASTL